MVGLPGKNVKELYCWLDGKFIRESEAKVPILTHSMQYGSGIFEGIRAYKTDKGAAIFRLSDHVDRFMRSAKVYSMDLGYGKHELADAIKGTVRKNSLESCYIRPFAFYDDSRIGVSAVGKRVSVFIAALPFGAYFGKEKERGIRCKVSSWRRMNSDVLPPQAKASGNYLNSVLANMDAVSSGANEAILVSDGGYVAEGPGENIFIVENGKLITPSRDSDILLGITRDSVIRMAERDGLSVEERGVHREELYSCDEAFFTGTAAEITPIISIDSRPVGNGKPGRITKMLSDRFSAITAGKEAGFSEWLAYV